MQKKQVLLLGSYGQDNLGDEAILEILVDVFKSRGFGITVNSSNPVKTEKTFNINAFSTKLFCDVIKKVKYFLFADLVVFGGGTLLVEHKDYFGRITRRPLYLTSFILMISRIFKKKTVLLGVGVEAIDTRLGKLLTKFCLQISKVVIVRDTSSLKFAEAIARKKIFLGADIVFLQKPERRRTAKNNCSMIGFAPTYWLRGSKQEKDDFIIFQSRLLKILSKNKQNKIFLIPFNTGNGRKNDVWLCKELVRLTGNKRIEIVVKKSPKDMFEFMRSLNFLVGIRLHACIFALLLNLPFLAISYEQKVKSLMIDFGLEDKAFDPFNEDVFERLGDLDWLGKYDYNHPYSYDEKLREIRNKAKNMLKFL